MCCCLAERKRSGVERGEGLGGAGGEERVRGGGERGGDDGGREHIAVMG